jgi:hypothetical protein
MARRSDIDWDAIERDYRTGKFTLRELAAKHGVSHQAIAKRVKSKGWTQDLGEAIRVATNARLTQELVDAAVANGRQLVDCTVAIAAEANVQVIQGHRKRLADLAGAVETAKSKVLGFSDALVDIREAAVFVQAVGNLANATKVLIEQERKAHGLDDQAQQQGGYEEMLAAVLAA